MKRKILLRESELIDLIEKIIKLNEVDNVTAVPPSPPSPPSKLTAVDFVGNVAQNIMLPDNIATLKNKFLFFQPEGQDYVTLEKTNPKEFCSSIGTVSTTGLKSILMPKVNASNKVQDAPEFPPVKYVCQVATDGRTTLRLVSIDSRDALEIKKKTGYDYNQESTKHLLRKTPGIS